MTEATATDAREAFALLGHEIRLDILLALLERWRAAHTEPQSYSTLMDAVGMEDSGKFNYHLKRLRGVYVRKVEDGYVPTASATALYRAVLGTRPTEERDRPHLDTDEPCPDCGTALRATYEGSFLTVGCPDCETTRGRFTYPFPANGLDERSDAEVLEAVRRRAEHDVELARSGQCPFCAGHVDVAVDPEATVSVEMTCETCSFVVGETVLPALKRVPRVSAALLALGVDVDTAQWWTLPTPTVSVESQEPLALSLVVERGGRTARIEVDGDLTVGTVTVDGASVVGP